MNNDFKIIVEDFNTVLDIKRDRRSEANIKLSNSATFVNAYLEENDLIDIWRIQNEEKFAFTWARLKPKPIMERIDYWSFVYRKTYVDQSPKPQVGSNRPKSTSPSFLPFGEILSSHRVT